MIDHEEVPLIGTKAKPGLLDWVRSKALVVPEFQREFLWGRKPDRTTSLLASIAQEWPAGALLLMEGDRGFQTQHVEGWRKEPKTPSATGTKYAILDGQQRLTALYQAFFNRSPSHVFVVAIMELLATEEIDPEQGGTFRAFGRKGWLRRFGDVEKQRDEGLIPVHDLINARAWDYWKDGFDQTTSEDLSELRDEGPLSGLIRYSFPASIVLKSAPDEALAKIFVTINQQGIRLTTFDLVVARTIQRKRGKQKGFNLREVWERAAGREETEDKPAIPAKYERIRNFGIDGETPLRLVRLLADTSTKLSDSSIIKLEPADVRQRIEPAYQALERTLEFLEKRIGLIPQTLADESYLLPVALAAAARPAVLRNKRDSELVLRWWWAATFRVLFGRGRTSDLIPEQAAVLVDWIIHSGPEPTVITEFWRGFDQELGRFVQGTSQNEHFMRAMFALEVAEGATDWRGLPDDGGGFVEFPLKDAGTWPLTGLDIHHIWARGVKAPKKKARVGGIELPAGDQAYEAVINRCLLLKGTNIAIGSTPFPNVVSLKHVRRKWMDTYLLDSKTDRWDAFVEKRLAKIRRSLRARI